MRTENQRSVVLTVAAVMLGLTFALSAAMSVALPMTRVTESAQNDVQWIRTQSLAGTRIVDADGNRIGTIEDVLLESSTGTVDRVVVRFNDSGRSRLVGVPWAYLAFDSEEPAALLVVDRVRLVRAETLDDENDDGEDEGYFPVSPDANFDPDEMVALEGTVVGVVEAPMAPESRDAERRHTPEPRDALVTIRTDAGSHLLSLGPVWFLEQNGIELAPDDTIQVRGSAVDNAMGPIVVATSIEAQGRRLRVRNDDGTALWR